MFICAQLDNEDVCFAVARLKAPIEGPNIIPLTEWREDILGWHYNRETGEFEPLKEAGN